MANRYANLKKILASSSLATILLYPGQSYAKSSNLEQHVLSANSVKTTNDEVSELRKEISKLTKEIDYLERRDEFDQSLANFINYFNAFISDGRLSIEEQKMASSQLERAIYIAEENPSFNIPGIWKRRYEQMEWNSSNKLNPYNFTEKGLEQELKSAKVEVDYFKLGNLIEDVFFTGVKSVFYGATFCLYLAFCRRVLERRGGG